MSSACVHDLVRARAERTPGVIGVLSDDRRLTYRELTDGAGRIAARLRARGIGTEDRVGICMERSPEMVLAVLGVLAAGAAYVPLDAGGPLSRRLRIVEEAEPAAVLTDGSAALGPSAGTAVETLDVADLLAGDGPRGLAGEPAALDDLAYVIYTSGSTGRPKGVAMTHRPLRNLIDWQLGSTSGRPAGGPPRTLQFTPLTFDVSFLEIFATLAAGGTLVLTDEARLRDPGALLELIDDAEVTGLFLPLVALQQLADTGLRTQVFPASLREVLTGGEQLTITPGIAGWFAGMPECVLQNIYGPTEAHVITTYELAGDPADWPRLPPIGTPIPGVRLRVAGPDLRPVATGEPGELCVGGVALARGYHGRPDLTAESFVTAPGDGERIYRTGDLVRELPGGDLQYLGRLDDQLKVQGVRVEPAEIEAVLGEHPDVASCAVVGREGGDGGKRLVAYVVPRDAPAQGISEPVTVPADPRWHGHLAERLPQALVPATYVLMPALPFTASGKVDRALLPAPSMRRPDLGKPFTPPRGPTQEALARIWAEVLQLDEVGADDGFLELGGNSLLLVRLQTRIGETLDREVRVATLLAYPTVRALAAHLDQTGDGTGSASSPGSAEPPESPDAWDPAGRRSRRGALKAVASRRASRTREGDGR